MLSLVGEQLYVRRFVITVKERILAALVGSKVITIIVMDAVLLVSSAVIMILIFRSAAATFPLLGDGHGKRALREIYGLAGNEDDTVRLRDILTRALAGSTNDMEFEASYRRIAGAVDELGDPCSWTLFTTILYQYRLSDTEVLTPRVLAVRYLKDIESRYHSKSAA